ncbi:hypothetical protein QTI17_17225 [Variovorax sp. J31P179]|uniref:hypothetical protein n=1 Tax=Variovorax sp. J31P179 TaxID=3053508 RepID=UPI0025775DB7|nr:hypothetical protein [Variovorax sp. J31P179]MDM0082337.1 hypothetical protein [Variovorax sp. J31P179]
MTDQEILRESVDLDKLRAECAKLKQERLKLRLDARKARREVFWHPVGVAAGLMGAGAALFGGFAALVLAVLKAFGHG